MRNMQIYRQTLEVGAGEVPLDGPGARAGESFEGCRFLVFFGALEFWWLTLKTLSQVHAIHPVWCHDQTRPTGVPEVIVLEDAFIVAFRLVFRLGWYRSDGVPAEGIRLLLTGGGISGMDSGARPWPPDE